MLGKCYSKAFSILTGKPAVLWGLSLLSAVLPTVAAIACGVIPGLGIAAAYAITCGISKVYIDALRGREVNADQLFEGFGKSFLRNAGGMAWMDFWQFLWSLVPVVGPVIGLVKGYSYAFVPYILMTRPEVRATEALRISKRMTHGIKGQMFLADLCYGFISLLCTGLLLWLSTVDGLGTLFIVILIVFVLAILLFGNIFTGLYRAAFFTEISGEGSSFPERYAAPAANNAAPANVQQPAYGIQQAQAYGVQQAQAYAAQQAQLYPAPQAPAQAARPAQSCVCPRCGASYSSPTTYCIKCGSRMQ